MEKRKSRSLASIYRKPLPVSLSVDEEGQLPPLIVHNPLSWVYLLCQMARIYVQKPQQMSIPMIPVETYRSGGMVTFAVRQEADMEKLWKEGFFGKGTLSRSDPSWRQRVLRRLKLDSGTNSDVSNEEVTRVRREERKKFKELRSVSQKYEMMERQNKLADEDRTKWEQIKVQLEEMKNWKQDFKVEALEEEQIRKEDSQLLKNGSLKENLEFVQLQKVEVVFLSLMGVVKVTNNSNTQDLEKSLTFSQMLTLCCGQPHPQSKFMLDYVVYHHFRSLGWCTRSGIKFGCDFLLYKRGPPFMHAEYGVMVINSDGQWKSWEDFMAVSRVVGGVRKTMVLVFVESPLAEQFNRVYRDDMEETDFVRLLSMYKVTEMISKRWLPSRTRD
ncbi:CIC11C00000004675 [Sungouiella intermedia]|uniref:tRNA-splicing endonuclease subunit Sen2 n=1 Tax=Sungouiella intermedia TaxID=45354 RepID=A0A1L0BQZ3_9ASCO|nr:CIC11C00000004675 [[Candida] intermedia]